MIYLITGANGAGKTLNTLKIVREKQLKENRPVYYSGFEMVADFGWQQIDPKKWQDLPDGSIVLVDECQNDFPVRSGSQQPPEYVRSLSEHRRRGFDFFMVSQHPQNVDVFIRRLIGSPGWHRHLKRAFGADLVSVLEWSSVNGNCEKSGAGKDASVSLVPFPKEVYSWYRSASLHTAKRNIPKAVYIFIACLILVPLLLWFGIKRFLSPSSEAVSAKPTSVLASQPLLSSNNSSVTPTTKAQWFSARAPRLEGFPQTAPVYDQISAPVEAPYPAACVQSQAKGCKCWSQQATLMSVPEETCVRIVTTGYFLDWRSSSNEVKSSKGPST